MGRPLLFAAALASAFVSFGGTWIIRGWWFDWFEAPAIIREQRAICTAEVTAAAAEATRNEQARQFAIGERATEQFLRRQAEANADIQAQIDVIEQENRDYEKRLQASGRMCGLDADDLDYLGMHVESGDPPGGGRAGFGGGHGQVAAAPG